MGRIETSRNKPNKIAGYITVAAMVAFGCMSCAQTDFAKENEGLSKLDLKWQFVGDKVTSTSDSSAYDDFGYAVGISQNYAIIGEENDNVGRGAVFIYKKNGASWTFVKKRVAPDAGVGYHFGKSVAITDEFAVVGSPNFDPGNNGDEGRAYIFRNNNDTWDILPANGGILTDGKITDGDEFGISVDISTNYIIVGAWKDDYNTTETDVGSVYFFYRNQGGADNWGSLLKRQNFIPPPPYDSDDPAKDDNFGNSVAITDNFAIVGAWQDSGTLAGEGSVYVFKNDSNAWPCSSKFYSSEPVTTSHFGWSVDLCENYFIVGMDYNNGAFIYNKSGNDWSLSTKIVMADGSTGDKLGYSVSINNDFALLGAPGYNSNHGAVMLFTRKNTSWIENDLPFQISDVPTDAQMGFSISMSSVDAVTGIPGDSPSGVELAGSTQFFGYR